jgi:two-component system CheB/CheR fusion protein
LLQYLKRNRGFDFTGYKPASLERRIQKRMETVGLDRYADYVDYLEVHPEEFSALFNTILINVTSFFRDDGAWKYMAEEAIPALLARSKGPVRAWSAGCASGEEAYTIAMILAEALGPEAYRDRLKIYATDVDEEALARGRQATYTENEVADVPPALLKKYFDRSDSRYAFRKDMRRQVIFGRHDLITDAPISRVDLLVCRNTLMYLNSETQAKILARFHFALNDGGVLFLGRAETLLTHATTFQPLDVKRRVSMKVSRPNLSLRDRLLLVAHTGPEEVVAVEHHVRLREIALDSTPVAQMILDASGALALTNERARVLFGLGQSDLGRPVQDMKISYRPVELRSVLEQAQSERRPVVMRDVEWQQAPGNVRWLDCQVVPLIEGGVFLGTSVTFTDVSAARILQSELIAAQTELQAAYEELQSTNEELETTNEELQSTVEELETTNEELQSTNEELETMNEELQSTNEELQTMNDELRLQSGELNRVNAFLESILTSLRGAVAVLDADMRVLVWNRHAEDMWGLRQDEVVGKHMLGLDIGLPVNELKAPIKQTTTSQEYGTMELDATSRRGRPFRCRVELSRLRGPDGDTRGTILIMGEVSAN